MSKYIWYLSLAVVATTLLLLLLLHLHQVTIALEYKYLAGAVGIAGFTFAVLGDGLFITSG